MIKGVIFDVDGTLIDSVDGHAAAWQETLARYGRVVPFEEVRSQIGKGGDQLMPVFLPKEMVERLGEQIERERLDLFKAKYLPRVRPFPEVRALFERIGADGKRIVLASSAKGEELPDVQEARPHRRPDRQRDLLGRRRKVEAAPRHLPRRDGEAAGHLARRGDRHRRHAV